MIVNKKDIPSLLSKYDRVEFRNDNKARSLKDPEVTRVRVYKFVPANDVQTIIGSCKSYSHLKIPLLTGVLNTTDHINYKTILKLREIENTYKINLSISKYIKKIVNEINNS